MKRLQVPMWEIQVWISTYVRTGTGMDAPCVQPCHQCILCFKTSMTDPLLALSVYLSDVCLSVLD
jgi:hypothetical protein